LGSIVVTKLDSRAFLSVPPPTQCVLHRLLPSTLWWRAPRAEHPSDPANSPDLERVPGMRGRASLLVMVCAVAALSPIAAARATVVIRVKAVTVSADQHDAPPKGISQGDWYFVRARLLNIAPQFGRKVGAIVGSDRGKLTFQSDTTWSISGTTTFPRGSLRWSGHGRVEGDRFVGPILVTGGTGMFAGARGMVNVSDAASPLNTYRLTLP